MGSKKIKLGLRAQDIVALVFVVLGAAFTAVCVLSALHMEQLKAGGSGDVTVLPVVFGSIGAPFLIVGSILAVLSLRKRTLLKRVVSEGYSVWADVADVRPNYSVEVNGTYPCVLECHYQDPSTGTLHIFKSRNLFFYPGELMGRKIRVYVDREKMSRYYVDVESLLPDVQVH